MNLLFDLIKLTLLKIECFFDPFYHGLKEVQTIKDRDFEETMRVDVIDTNMVSEFSFSDWMTSDYTRLSTKN